MACIDSREVKCEQDILTAIIDGSGLSPQGTDGIRRGSVRKCLVMDDGRGSWRVNFRVRRKCVEVDYSLKSRCPDDDPSSCCRVH